MALGKEISEGVRVYRAADAPFLEDTDATSTDFEASPQVKDVAIKLAGSDCSINKILAQAPIDEGGTTVCYLFFKPNFPLFPHKHDVNSMYVVISGSIVDFMGNEVLRPGDCWSVKKGNPYHYSAGPEGVEVLELFSGQEHVKIILTDAAGDRLDAAEEAVRQNESAWKKITEGPLFKANRGG
jgi:hypothetical protein